MAGKKIANSRDPEELKKVAYRYERERKFPLALPYLEKLSRMYPGTLAYQGFLGSCYFQTQQYDKALAIFQQCLELKPMELMDEIQIHLYIAEIYRVKVR